MKKMEEISIRIGDLMAGDEISEELSLYENWLNEQLTRIRNFKQSKKPLIYNRQIFDAICLNSVLITSYDFNVIKSTGFFSYIFALSKATPFNYSFLDFIEESHKAEFLSFFNMNQTSEFMFLYETRIQLSELLGFRVIFKVMPLAHKRQFLMSIKNIQAQGENNSNPLWGFEDDECLHRNGISLLLFGREYELIDRVGAENRLFTQNDTSLKNLFNACIPEYAKRIYPFVNRALKGMFNSGKIRIEENVFDIHAFPVRDTNGFTYATVILTKNSTN